ncbi:erythromycin esterase family protein [Kribbella albertanoniae]|uniref:Erythromycin esterase family protein n=1 Tax=Kribbella albertanoniae TaxID=1266829 RepID=A0A4R4NZ36_9ACTN|nr:erythromycin esterase family protein [Kribbella albertanoniae]TDC15191.1 erythromycin esterase family protein [Kribbella albertanoniae]
MDLLKLLANKPRLLALGEPTHLENDLLRLRNEVFRRLVEDEGYRTITVESDCLMGLVVDDYVTSGKGELDEVMARGFSHEWGGLAGNRELVEWMRTFNQGRVDQVRFAGFDGPLETSSPAGPRPVLTTLHAYLANWLDADLLPCTSDALDDLLGSDDRWTNPATMMDPTQSIGQTADAERLQLIAGDLAVLVDTQTPYLIAASSREDWQRARLYARTATGLLRYHYWMADQSDRRIARLLAQRDSMMAANLLDLVDRGPTLVFAHNGHLQREKSSMNMAGANHEWWSAGALVNAHLGAQYAFFATALGTMQHREVGTPPAGTIEGVLYAQDQQLIDPRTLNASLKPRVSPWFGYAALQPNHLPSIDGIVFLKDVNPS